jgi:aminoglycoside phosphotransferase family enzyme
MWANFPRSASSGYHAEFHEGCYQKHTTLLNRRTSSSDISGYHADFHEVHNIVVEWQGRGMACVN